ncbi:hypothetical protein HYU22_04510 [Candidatus Woesearchaeota archaeon]|nr:hypothetical protein [Candidatus Woesearchaeota archaeon]
MSKKKENRADLYQNASVGKVLLAGLVILVLVGGLWLLYSSSTAKQGPVAGKAVSGIANAPARIGVLAEGVLALDPVSGDAALNEPFTIDVIVNPIDPAAAVVRFTNYKFVINFNQDVLTYVSARNLVPGAGWTFSSVLSAPGQLTITADSPTDFFGPAQTALAEITFNPTNLFPIGTPITPSNFKNINSYGFEGASVVIVNSYAAGMISIYNRWYPDVDRDSYGDAAAPGIVGPDPGDGGFVLDHSDCNDADPAINPGAAEVCDGVDNNCAAGVADEVPPTCADLAVQCGIHRVCANSRFLDCNKGGPAFDGALLLGAQKCAEVNPGFVCNDAGACVDPNAGCPAPVICPPAVVCPTCALLTMPQPLTPGCGVDGDGDGSVCDYFETTVTCPTDCGTCPGAVADGCSGVDSDTDGLSDAYESYLDGVMVGHGFVANSGFDPGRSDSDSDGVDDGSDFCPGTDVTAGQSLANGRINVNGCYAGDVGTASHYFPDRLLCRPGRFSAVSFRVEMSCRMMT